MDVTAVVMEAIRELISGRRAAGIPVEQTISWEELDEWLDRGEREQGGRYRYDDGRRETPLQLAVARMVVDTELVGKDLTISGRTYRLANRGGVVLDAVDEMAAHGAVSIDAVGETLAAASRARDNYPEAPAERHNFHEIDELYEAEEGGLYQNNVEGAHVILRSNLQRPGPCNGTWVSIEAGRPLLNHDSLTKTDLLSLVNEPSEIGDQSPSPMVAHSSSDARLSGDHELRYPGSLGYVNEASQIREDSMAHLSDLSERVLLLTPCSQMDFEYSPNGTDNRSVNDASTPRGASTRDSRRILDPASPLPSQVSRPLPASPIAVPETPFDPIRGFVP